MSRRSRPPDPDLAERLLVLDDDPNLAEIVCRGGAAVGLSCRAADTAEEFLRLVSGWSPSYIVIDLVMPEKDGVEVLAELARLGCEARIIIMSGLGSRVLDAAGRSATERGLNLLGVLGKPFRLSALESLLVRKDQAPTAAHTAHPRETSNEWRPDVESLRRAIERREFFAVFQPSIDCATGELVSFEALARWQHPVHGEIQPSRFIPALEETSLVEPFTCLMCERAMQWLGQAQRVGVPEVAINISAAALQNTLFDCAMTSCNNHGVSPSRVTLELTETHAMQDPTHSLAILTRLRVNGFHLSIDDFGTGYSSMAQLVRLPFSELKVDRSFVMRSTQSEEAGKIVKSIVDLGHSLGLRTVAEGVENQATFDYLTDLRCGRAQGYWFAKPMRGEDALDWVEQRRQTH